MRGQFGSWSKLIFLDLVWFGLVFQFGLDKPRKNQKKIQTKQGLSLVWVKIGLHKHRPKDEMLSGSSHTICLKWDEFDGIAGDKYGLEVGVIPEPLPCTSAVITTL
jgi:hypothetical protein